MRSPLSYLAVAAAIVVGIYAGPLAIAVGLLGIAASIEWQLAASDIDSHRTSDQE